MLSNFHTHTNYCDGKNSPEEIVLHAIDRGFCSVGFSGHAYTPYDLRYCMKDTPGYMEEINNLKEKYKNKIQIYLGAEEDSYSFVQRDDFDYIIGSSHYFCVNGKYYPIDSGYDYFKVCLELFDGDIKRLSHNYYKSFCEYISVRKPDIVGHFDLITKYDESETGMFLCDEDYIAISGKYISEALKNDVIFEVNTGAIARGLRTTAYPHESLLHIIKKHAGKVILSSDSHSADTLDFHFDETRKFLRDIGFEYVYYINDGRFEKDFL